MWLLADEKKSLEILKSFLKTSTKKVVAVEVWWYGQVVALWEVVAGFCFISFLFVETICGIVATKDTMITRISVSEWV